MYYIATFFSHFGAIRFGRECREAAREMRLMPVPRDLSASCGTCVRFAAPEDYVPEPDSYGELMRIVRETAEGYEVVYDGE